MIVHAGRQELYSIAVHAAKAAARNTTIEELKGIHIEADAARGLVTLTATNIEVAVRATLPATVQEGGSAVVPAQLFTGILNKLPGSEVNIASSGVNRMDFSAGTAAYRIAVLSADKYPMPELPFPEDSVAVQGLRSLYRRTAFAAAADQEKAVFPPVGIPPARGPLVALLRMETHRGHPNRSSRFLLIYPMLM